MSTLSESYDCVFLQGLIDNKYPIHMTIRTNGGRGGEMFDAYQEWIEGAYYYDAVLWAKDTRVTAGTSETTFSPNEICTRGQVMTFLYAMRPQ